MSNITDPQIDIFSLDIAIRLLKSKKKKDQLKPPEISFLSTSLNLYLRHYEEILRSKPNQKVRDLDSFLESDPVSDLEKIRDYLKKNNGSSEIDLLQESQSNAPEKENTSIPVTLETMRASWEDNQASLVKDEKSKNSVAKTVERARKTWNDRRKIELIYENAAKENKELEEKRQAETDKYYVNAVDSKAKSKADITQNSTKLIYYSLLSKKESISLSKADFDKSVQDILYLAETGAIDIDDYRQLNIVTELTLRDNLKNYQTEFSYVDDLVEKRNKLEAENPYNEELEAIEEIIDYSDEENFQDINGTTKRFVQELASKYQDYDVLTLEAKKEAAKITNGLSTSIHDPKFLFEQTSELDKHGQELEKAIRQDVGLSAIAGGLSSRVVGVLDSTGAKKVVSGPAVDLYNKGLTPEKLRELEERKDSKTYEILSKNRTLQKQIEFQIKKIHNSTLGEEIRKDIKPISDTFSRYSPTVQKILDPVGTAKGFINKKIGQHTGNLIVKYSSSAAAKEFGNFILENGLKEGAKKFADAAAKKLLIEGAKAVGVQTAKVAGMAATDSTIAAIAVAAGIPTAGVSLLIGAALIVVQIGYEITIGLLKKGWSEIKKAFGVTEEDEKENKKALLAALAILAATAIALKSSGKYFGVATKAALVSAVGIIWLALATIAVFLTFTFMVAPLLSTLVQFDSEEKVEYTENGVVESGPVNCGNMPWPFASKYPITQGPKNTACTHHGTISESADFGTPLGTPILSMTSGTVVDAIKSNEGYGNHVKIQAATDDGKTFLIIYAHFSILRIGKGAKVEKGTVLGLSGNSGYSTGPHLHVGYSGIEYNSCPAGNHKIKDNCCSTATCNQP